MSDDVDRSLSAVLNRVELVDVRLMDSGVRTKVRDTSSIPSAQLTVNHGTRVIHRGADMFIVRAVLDAKVLSGGQEATESQPPIRMTAGFALQYLLPNASDVSDEVLEEFARVNGAFNAWPYFREYLQSTSARMNLPPLVLPVLRIAAPTKGEPLAEPRKPTHRGAEATDAIPAAPSKEVKRKSKKSPK